MFELPAPRRHTPWLRGVYDVGPNLKLLGEEPAFEFDQLWPRLRANKLLDLPNRVFRKDLDAVTVQAAQRSIAERLARGWPSLFSLEESLKCHLTGDAIDLAGDQLDALVTNLPCDLAIVKRTPSGDQNVYLNICTPSHWRPEEKIGTSFVATHAPIPHFEKVNAAAPKLVDAMIEKGPWVRFVWGLDTDDELDHHPDRAGGREFATKPFVVRVERQVLVPLPEVDASLFFIGLGFVKRDDVLADEALWRPLKNALLNMSPAARAYKGVAADFEALMAQFPVD